MGQFEIKARKSDSSAPSQQDRWGNAVLYHTAKWFTYVRWAIAASLIVAGLVTRLFPDTFIMVGIDPPRTWLLVLGLAVAVGNVPLALSAARLREDSPKAAVELNLWFQIAADLLAVTALVHYAGSTTTFAPFIYLFHIVLGCIFFSSRTSALILFLAVASYAACVHLEIAGILATHCLLASVGERGAEMETTALLRAVSAVGIWIVVWWLVSTLAASIRMRDVKLSKANDELVKLEKEQHSRVVRVVNDLKMSFSGIKTSVELLQIHHADKMSKDVQSHFSKVYSTTHLLEARIDEILQLGDVDSPEDENETPDCDLSTVFDHVRENMRENAWRRGIKLDLEVPSLRVQGRASKLAVLFSNLVSNAIEYSEAGGSVKVSTHSSEAGCGVKLVDNGIGIDEKDLPHIFEENYRSESARAVNPSGAGLGLSVVSELVHSMGLTLDVESEPGKGSTFHVIIPLLSE